ncbi:MAG: PHP domain-containing protein, partial [Chloroflexi bacterium]|nr:PHP domain-containing protein [Chloroflexota bacterium]
MLIDLHTHTAPKSYDALQTPEELVLEAKGLGLDALCLTEHDTFWEAADLQNLSRRHGLLLLPGSEVNTDEGHFLAFGLKEYGFGMHKLPFLRQQVDQAGGVLVAAHPYRRRGLAG